jgi:CRP-like cAMP-binding protein
MPNRALRKIQRHLALSDAERRAFLALLTETKLFKAGADVVSDGEWPPHSTVILTGITCRYRVLPTGARQILAFQIAGDLCDMHSLLLQPMDHAIGAITECRVAQVPHRRIHEVIRRFPRLGLAFWRDTLVDGALFREWMVGMGRRSAYERVAHVLCEVHFRLSAVGLASGYSFELPLTQIDLADAMGLSAIHVHRVLQQLKREKLATFRKGTVVIHDWEQLRAAAGFDPRYLQIGQAPPM